jgi:hypothetical protein
MDPALCTRQSVPVSKRQCTMSAACANFCVNYASESGVLLFASSSNMRRREARISKVKILEKAPLEHFLRR